MKFLFDNIEEVLAFADRVRLVETANEKSGRSKEDDEYREMLRTSDRVIEAIKLYRSRHDVTLKAAKDYIEGLRVRAGL